MSEENKNNMELWDSWSNTAEMGITTKKVEYGSFKFTAIDAQQQLKLATRKWGPHGITWGLRNLIWGEIGKVKSDKSIIPAEITLDAEFWYPNGTFPISSEIKYRPGGDSRKKLLTDVTTKALSKLGMCSDIFEGKFDGNKYNAPTAQAPVQAQQPPAAPQQAQPVQATQPPQPQNTDGMTHLSVDTCEAKTASSGNPMLEAKLLVHNGSYNGKNFKAWFTCVPFDGNEKPPFPFLIFRKFALVTAGIDVPNSHAANLFQIAQGAAGKNFMANLVPHSYTNKNSGEPVETMKIDGVQMAPFAAAAPQPQGTQQAVEYHPDPPESMAPPPDADDLELEDDDFL